MKFTLSWLKEFLDTTASITEIAERLTAIGLEVEQVLDRAQDLQAFTVAEIIEAGPHPQADKLRLCKVNNGTEILQIVCGAPNARAGIKVVLASIGSVIPSNNLTIKAATIRGVESNGMLCSAAELLLTEYYSGGADGIIELPLEVIVGASFVQQVGLDDPIIEVAITPNRGDCLGIYGIARDLASTGIGTLKPYVVPQITAKAQACEAVRLDDSAACSMFTARAFTNVQNGESPAWLKNRLLSIGEKPISILVDITNYITFTYGRPLHVFDADRLRGNIVVRKAALGEKFAALNDKTYVMDGSETVVADDSGVIGLGGIMGGSSTGVDMATRHVILESALFNAESITKTGRKHNIDSDARYRFERQVDPCFVDVGAQIGAQMIVDLCGGAASEVVISGQHSYKPRIMQFDLNLIQTVGGVLIEPKLAKEILTSLGYVITTTASPEIIEVTVPSWRNDVTIPLNLVEDVIRIYGYQNLASVMLPRACQLQAPALNQARINSNMTRRILGCRGLNEIISWSFMSSKKYQLFGEVREELMLANPISSDLDLMRGSIIPNLIDSVKKSLARSFKDLSFFEIGPIFHKIDQQELVAAGIRYGMTAKKNIYHDMRAFDVYDVKADVLEALLGLGITTDEISLHQGGMPNYYHPGRSACLKLGDERIAYFGELHPKLVLEFDLKSPAQIFEIFLDNVKFKQNLSISNELISDFQGIERDYAFIIDKSFPVGNLIGLIKALAPQIITGVYLFDLYQGLNLQESQQSVALTVTIQALDHTLTGAEIEQLHQEIIAEVEGKTGGKLRT